MSRETDTTKDMNTRVAEANAPDINFIVTIHANSSTNTSARGTQSFYPSTHDIGTSTALATSIYTQLKTIFPEFAPPTTHDGIGLLTTHTAVLVEMGFMSNADDLTILKTQQDQIAWQIYLGIRKWWWGY